MSTIKVDNLQTTGGAGLYPAKAWLLYNQRTPAIVSDGNISSVTDVSTGRFTPSYSSSFANANYAFTAVSDLYEGSFNSGAVIGAISARSTGSVALEVDNVSTVNQDRQSGVVWHGS